MDDTSKQTLNANAAEPLESARLVVHDHEILIAVDSSTRRQILQELQASNRSDPISYDERDRSWAKNVFRRLAIYPAGIGMIASVAGNFFATFHNTSFALQAAEYIPIILAGVLGISNLAVLYLRPQE